MPESEQIKSFRKQVQARVQTGNFASLKSAFDRMLADGKKDEARVIYQTLRKHLNPDDDFLKTALARLRNRRITVTSPELSFERFCAGFKGLAWRTQGQSWLSNVTKATWQEIKRLRRYVAPLSSGTFRIADKEFREKTAVLSLQFVEDSNAQVRIKFTLRDRKFAVLTLKRDRDPPLGKWPLQGILTAVAVVVYRDCVVAEPPTAGASAFALTPRIGSAPSMPSSRSNVLRLPSVYPVPRPSPPMFSGYGGPRSGSYVRGHARWLPYGQSASAEAITAALAHGIILGPDATFVRAFYRGGTAPSGLLEREARSRRMSPALLDSLHHAAQWT